MSTQTKKTAIQNFGRSLPSFLRDPVSNGAAKKGKSSLYR